MRKKAQGPIPAPVPSDCRVSCYRNRKQSYRDRRKAEGLVQVSAWIPIATAPDFYVMAAMLKENRELAFGPFRHVRTGHFVKF